ncbi:YiiX/YebB-like N1pC/P60 family cysteine hydrolase [sulfur-oxidizing endosymbiont of Gigantopelta aegis]|uniref:YiiX/YebB-like N1pC/P60 family cysteine hydrolase n=1 Tax=sulfur-oxidizing endosymbiont of Gigantopelta aegis TaxID=2794934 RepID=UPI0018DBF65B|nr:YiiX/YebB-like N1pC/P60 family cysteine hydrolase [sulfur-oxidizing endosymbiont of Gigantopelta aegis]
MLHQPLGILSKLLLIFFVLQNTAFATCQWNAELSPQVEKKQANQLTQDIETYYSLIEESLQHRSISLQLFGSLQNELESNAHLSAASLNHFKQAIKTHLKLRQRLYDMVQARKCWLPEEQNNDENFFVKQTSQAISIMQLKGIMLSLSAALNLYDNYLLVVASFQQEPQLRRIIDQPDSGFGLSSNHLMDATLAFNSVINRAQAKQAIQFYQREIKAYLTQQKNAEKTVKNDSVGYLKTLIEQSPSYQILQKNASLSFLQNKIKFYTVASNDSLVKLENEGVNLLSLLFGNTIGLVEARKGKLYQQKDLEQQISQQLKAGDILLEKTPFRLTDQFIPGYWGHAAIWIGNEQELRALDLWTHPIVQPWQKKINQGHAIVEALRSGVELDPLSHFMNIDDMAILRDNKLSKSQLRQVILNAFRQLGKAYDFNFDITTSDRIVCSELIYVSYLHIDWPVEKALGRYTISPDHIAAKVKDDTLNIVSLFLHGKEMTDNKKQHFINVLDE